jgi:hypothetical protein
MASQTYIEKTIAILVAAYPFKASDADRMRPFLKMVERVLEPYPHEVLDRLANPRTGIVAVCTFFPSIAEIKKFCEREWDKISPHNRYDREAPALLSREDDTPERRANVIEKFADLMRDLRMAPDFARKGEPVLTKAEAKQQAEDWLAREAAKSAVEPPPMLSATTLAKMGVTGL